MTLQYNRSEKINGYIYFYENDKIIAVYNLFTGLCIKK